MKQLLPLFAVTILSYAGAANAVPVLSEGFEGGIPGSWTVTDDSGVDNGSLTWGTLTSGTCADAGDGNYTNGSGNAACASSDRFGSFVYDTSLITSSFSLAAMTSASLSYTANYQNVAAQDFLDTDISLDGGSNWINLLSWNEDHGGFFAAPGEDVLLDLTTYVGATDVTLRWRYHENINGFDWYAQIDDVLVEGTPEQSDVPEPGTLALLGLGLAGIGFARRKKA